MDTTLRGYDQFVRITWDEAVAVAAKTIDDVARTYNGEEGAALLEGQGYEPVMVEAMHGAGVQVIKMRGGMPLLGAGRVFGFYRFANMLALLDAKIRPDAPPEEIVGSRAFDNYAWHTDLPPGHPMVTGNQTVDAELFTAENSKLIVLIGMNWICTKMPTPTGSDARLHGARVIVIWPTTAAPGSRRTDPDRPAGHRRGPAPRRRSGVDRHHLYDHQAVVQHRPACSSHGHRRPVPRTVAWYGRPSENYVALSRRRRSGRRRRPPFTAARSSHELRRVGRLHDLGSANGPAAPATRSALMGATRRSRASSTSPCGRHGGQGAAGLRLLRQYLDDTFDLRRPPRSPAPRGGREPRPPARRQQGNTFLAAGMGPNHYFNNDLSAARTS
jgi:hypothetical protein